MNWKIKHFTCRRTMLAISIRQCAREYFCLRVCTQERWFVGKNIKPKTNQIQIEFQSLCVTVFFFSVLYVSPCISAHLAIMSPGTNIHFY